MILLASTSDLLKVITDDAANIDVHASWVDGISTFAPGRTNTLITTATTTTVVGSPAASTYRTIKSLTLRNRSTTAASRVTVVHTDGSNAPELIKCVIMPLGSLHYNEGAGFQLRRHLGPPEIVTVTSATAPAVGDFYAIVLPEDVVVASATASRQIDVRQFGFPVAEGGRYWFRYSLFYTSAATATGGRFNIYGPGLVTAARFRADAPTSTTARQPLDGLLAYDASSAHVSSAATGSNIASIEGFIDTPTCDGLVFLRIGSEISASAITLKAGSVLHWQRMT